MKFNKSIVVDAHDMPQHVREWCDEQERYEISTHCAESLVRISKDDTDTYHNALIDWLIAEGVDMEEYSDDRMYYVSVIGT